MPDTPISVLTGDSTADYDQCADYTNLSQESKTEDHVYSKPEY